MVFRIWRTEGLQDAEDLPSSQRSPRRMAGRRQASVYQLCRQPVGVAHFATKRQEAYGSKCLCQRSTLSLGSHSVLLRSHSPSLRNHSDSIQQGFAIGGWTLYISRMLTANGIVGPMVVAVVFGVMYCCLLFMLS